jgi:hypothetical protein
MSYTTSNFLTVKNVFQKNIEAINAPKRLLCFFKKNGVVQQLRVLEVVTIG